jgi:hypothetical protein
MCLVCRKSLEWKFARFCKEHGLNGSVWETIYKIQAIARPLGWAVAVHGSLDRDIDLIAVPWVEDAKGTWDVFEAIRDGIGTDHKSARGDLRKPCGRQALMIIPKGATHYKGKNGMDDWRPPAIDMSFLDPREGLREIAKLQKEIPLNEEEKATLMEVSDCVHLMVPVVKAAITYTFAKDMDASRAAKLNLFKEVCDYKMAMEKKL